MATSSSPRTTSSTPCLLKSHTVMGLRASLRRSITALSVRPATWMFDCRRANSYVKCPSIFSWPSLHACSRDEDQQLGSIVDDRLRRVPARATPGAPSPTNRADQRSTTWPSPPGWADRQLRDLLRQAALGQRR